MAKRFLANKGLGAKVLDNPVLAKLGELAFLYHQKLVVAVIFLLIVALFFCLLSYDVADPAWSHISSHTNATPTNVFGQAGALLADLLYTFLGQSAWLCLLWLGLEALFIQAPKQHMLPLRWFAYVFLQVCGATMLAVVAHFTAFDGVWLAGIVGAECFDALAQLLGLWGAVAFIGLFGMGIGYLLVAVLFFAPPAKLPNKPQSSQAPTQTAPKSPAQSHQAPPKPPQRPKGVLAAFLLDSGLSDELRQPSSPKAPKPSTPPQATQGSDQIAIKPSPPVFGNQPQTTDQTTPKTPPQKPKPITKDADDVLAGFNIGDKDPSGSINSTPTLASEPTNFAVTPSDTVGQLPPKAASTIQITPVHHTDTAPTGITKAQKPTDAAPVEHTTQPKNSQPLPPSVHDDLAGQSFAMATAAHRASLSPLPSLDLLDPSTNESFGYGSDELTELAERLQIKLKEFNIEGVVRHIIQGPIVTSFEIELAAGVRASRVTTITTDLARSLAVEGLRVVEVIPGKPYIGIEISNKSKQTIKLIDLLGSSDYQSDDKTIAMAVGKGVAGEPVIADLAKAPHMLVAGTTGSGKSVLVNSLILSMLLKYRPEELRLVIIDPKEVDFAFYADIPHLLTPIVTDIETDTLPVLSWCVAEMERRYQLMKALRVQKLTELNAKIHHANAQDAPLIDPLWQPSDHVSTTPPKLAPLPFIVIIADEYNDMVKQVGKPLEDAVVRIAQKARAAGIHIIIATQRPSVDVITGIIKSNIPSRVAMYLKNKVDSRTVIDAGGAETLLGNGDMLFVAPGSNQISRVHGAFVSQGEITRIAEAWRQRGGPDYVDLSQDNGEGYIQSDDTADPLYQEAVAFVVDSGKTSISAIQRKLSIGYNRAANIVDDMQARGILSPPDNSGKRTLLL